MSNSEDLDRIESELRAYFARNPHAADTIAGIRSWWLRDTCPNCPLRLLQQALQRMLSNNEVACTTNLSGEIIYSKRLL